MGRAPEDDASFKSKEIASLSSWGQSADDSDPPHPTLVAYQEDPDWMSELAPVSELSTPSKAVSRNEDDVRSMKQNFDWKILDAERLHLWRIQNDLDLLLNVSEQQPLVPSKLRTETSEKRHLENISILIGPPPAKPISRVRDEHTIVHDEPKIVCFSDDGHVLPHFLLESPSNSQRHSPNAVQTEEETSPRHFSRGFDESTNDIAGDLKILRLSTESSSSSSNVVKVEVACLPLQPAAAPGHAHNPEPGFCALAADSLRPASSAAFESLGELQREQSKPCSSSFSSVGLLMGAMPSVDGARRHSAVVCGDTANAEGDRDPRKHRRAHSMLSTPGKQRKAGVSASDMPDDDPFTAAQSKAELLEHILSINPKLRISSLGTHPFSALFATNLQFKSRC
uniref:Uncharacterized protein n=1 Tax=Cyanoptyche gloeocystis TaxID=77922 RepID=A0A7S2JMZ0_9EUKA|mmetsp:Transcript_324/g.681  ORF Transcript_324/g.681 Transcript_324/m.681 type:complete len:397 (+) Transcript_324:49-1239(+)